MGKSKRIGVDFMSLIVKFVFVFVIMEFLDCRGSIGTNSLYLTKIGTCGITSSMLE